MNAKLSWVALAALSISFSAEAQQWSGDDNYSPAPAPAPERAPRRSRGSRGFSARPVGHIWFSIDPTFILPVGDLSDRAGIGLGGTGAVQYSFKPRTLVSFRSGYLMFMRKKNLSASIYTVPFLVGLKHYLKPRLFIYPEMGLVIAGTSCKGDVQCPDSETNVGGSLAVGWDFTPEVNLRGGLYLPDLGDLGDVISFFVALSWDIWSD